MQIYIKLTTQPSFERRHHFLSCLIVGLEAGEQTEVGSVSVAVCAKGWLTISD